MMRWLTTPACLVPVLLAAFWPVWRWYVARMSDGSDEPLGLLALLVAAALLPRRGWRQPVATPALIAACAALATYAGLFAHVPPLIRGAFAMVALAVVLPRDAARPWLPQLALLLLSLPLIATLQYFLGYPVRAVTAWCAAHLLGLAGIEVVAQGTVLLWSGEEVLVDAPCSGIRMLWTSAFLSASLAALLRLPALRFLRLAQGTAAIVFAANLARTVVLFFLETGLWPNPPWAHETAGLVVFACAALGCAAAAQRLRPRVVVT